MALKNKYQREKQQYSNDGGVTWHEVSPANYRRGRLIEAGSEDCNTVEWKEVTGSWFCIGFNETQYRWVDSGNFECHIGDKYPIEQEEISRDGGSTWTPTGETRYGEVIRNSSDCPIVYNQEYLTIEILDTGNSDTATVYSNISGLEYRVDNGEWQTYNGGIVCEKGSKIQWRGNLTTTNNQRMFNVSDNATYQTFGNINSVYDYDTFTDNCYDYENFFYNGKNLLYADNLILPATTLTQAAYKCMFNGCESLAKAPVLPATELAIDCYSEMFKGCAITTAPALPATRMYQGCYYAMFGNCKQLVNAPQLPATELADGCYMSMFHSCWALQNAPQLPATTMYQSCYQSMFQDCKNLLAAPELPATTLADYCYAYMFWGCTLLASVPTTLPATELRRYCYEYMFQDCISLTGAPVLPATTFRNPAIVAEVNNGLAMYAYNRMFSGCTRLQYIKAMFASIPDNYTIRNFTSDWVYNVASTGTFVQNGGATWHEVGKDGIPSGWTIVYDGARWITVENEYICNGRSKYAKEKEQISSDGGETWTDTGRTRRGEIISETSTDCSKWVTDTDAPTVTALNQRFVKMKEQLTYDDGETWEDTGNTKYAIDSTYVADFDSFKNEYLTVEVNENMTTLTFRRGITSTSGWNDFNNMMARGVTIGENGATYASWIPSIPSNIQDFDFIQFKAEGYASSTQRPNLQSDAPYRVFGNVNSLFASDNFATDTTTTQVLRLFYHSNVEDAENVYSDNSNSCKEWFYYCDKLVKAPKTIYNAKYYESMFHSCTSLTKASRFAGSDVGYNGFVSTFSGCTKLIEARIDAVNIYSTSTTNIQYMFNGVTTNGTLYVPSNSPFITGTYISAVPSTWTTVTE